MGKIVFKQVEDKVFVTEPWPKLTEFAQEFFFVPSDRVIVKDLNIMIVTDNGIALYKVIEIRPVFGLYTARLIKSTFEPEYSFATEKADG